MTDEPNYAHLALWRGDPRQGGIEVEGPGYNRKRLAWGSQSFVCDDPTDFGPAGADWGLVTHAAVLVRFLDYDAMTPAAKAFAAPQLVPGSGEPPLVRLAVVALQKPVDVHRGDSVIVPPLTANAASPWMFRD